MGIEYHGQGQTIYDFGIDEQRERTFWTRGSNAGYPTVGCYTGMKNGVENVYYGYQYTGGLDQFEEKMEEGPDLIIPMKDSFF